MRLLQEEDATRRRRPRPSLIPASPSLSAALRINSSTSRRSSTGTSIPISTRIPISSISIRRAAPHSLLCHAGIRSTSAASGSSRQFKGGSSRDQIRRAPGANPAPFDAGDHVCPRHSYPLLFFQHPPHESLSRGKDQEEKAEEWHSPTAGPP